jgi:hypothetical protein
MGIYEKGVKTRELWKIGRGGTEISKKGRNREI